MNPLSLNPFLIKKLLYNPRPLGRLIGRAYLEALETTDPGDEYIGRATMEIIERELNQLQRARPARRVTEELGMGSGKPG